MAFHPASPRLIGIGGAHIDRRGRVDGRYVPAASNPGTLREDVGGVVFNALRHAARRGVTASLISMRGGDDAGERIGRAIAEAGIDDRSAVFLDRASASYTALLDHQGDLIAGLADMALYDGFARQLRRSACREAIAAADAVLCDANLPADALRLVAQHADGRPVHAIGISPAKIVRLAGLLPQLDTVFMNVAEARALADEPALEPVRLAVHLAGAGLRRGVITDGARRVVVFDGAIAWTVEPQAPRSVADVTGAGDALAGVTVAAVMRGLALPDAVRHGIAAATLTVESSETVPPIADDALADAVARVPPAVALD